MIALIALVLVAGAWIVSYFVPPLWRPRPPDIAVTQSSDSDVVPASALTTETRRLVDGFDERGHETTTLAGSGKWLFREAPAVDLVVDGVEFTVWDFGNQAAAVAALGNIAPDGTVKKVMGTSDMGSAGGMRYPAPPHFFRRGQLVALYFAVKADQEADRVSTALDLMREGFGQQVAGAAQ